jgi:hypothetical protein
MSETNNEQQPTVITLDKNSSINIFIQYIEIAQKAGAYELKEAEILKRSTDVLINNVTDPEINENLAINLLIQGINKGQKHGGAFTLNDAALLHKVIQFMINSSQPQQPSQQEISSDESANENDTEATPETEPEPEVDSGEDDLASLSEPVPLRPKEI